MNLISRFYAYAQAINPGNTTNVFPFVPRDSIHIDLMRASADEHASVSTPILACTARTVCPVLAPTGLDFVILSSHSSLPDIQEGLDTNARGFDPVATAGMRADPAALRAQLITNRPFMARLNNQFVAAGFP